MTYSPPRVFDAVQRPRLFDLLNQNAHCQNFFIIGQAAQGKTTLVASYLQEFQKTAVWFHLCSDDNDHVKLAEKLAAGISWIGRSDSGAVAGGVPPSTLGAEKGVSRYLDGVSRMFEALLFPLVVVMDDGEYLQEGSSGFELVNSLLNHRFARVKFFILSRNILQFGLSRMRMAHHGFELDNSDLAFTVAETQVFFSQKKEAALSDIQRIHKITDGWAGGLTLISESMRQSRGLGHLPDRVSSDVFDYFSREIYNTLPDSIRRFLMVTAILDTIDPDLADQLVHPVDGLEILTTLEKRNLFIQRLEGDGHGPTFKYHRLFRDFLLQDLTRTLDHETICNLYHTAGRIYWNKKDHEQALDCFVRAKAYPDVVNILKIKGTAYIISGKITRLEKWISALPEALKKDDPWLIFFSTMTRRIKGGKKNILAFQRALSLFDQRNDIRGMLLSVGHLIEAAVFMREPSVRILKWITTAERYLAAASGTKRFPWARALLWQQIGLGYIAGNGDIPKGVSACRNAILLARQINHPDLVFHASITMTFGYVQAGDFTGAGQLLAKIEAMTDEGLHPEFCALKHIVDIDLALKNGWFEAAGRLLQQSEQEIETFGLIFLYPGFVEAGAVHRIYTGQFDDACRMADHLNDFSILEGNDFYKGISHRIKALSFLKQGDAATAALEIQMALDTLGTSKKGDIHHFLTQQLAGIIFLETDDLIKAGPLLDQSLTFFEQISSDLSCVETHLISGVMAWKQKDVSRALERINQGLTLASRKAYTFFPLVTDTVLVKAIVIWVGYVCDREVLPAVLSLGKQCSSSCISAEIDWLLSETAAGETVRVTENLRVLHTALLPEIRIETLGQFAVLCNDQLIDPKAFEGSRPILLLKSIVLHGSRDIPKEVLIDDLWPKASAAAGEKNFKINFHRLRKALEPNVKKAFGYAYIVQKAGLVSLDPELVRLDVSEFLSFALKAQENEKNNHFETALTFYEHAADLYKGDYFSEELYLEWISRKRDLLREKYIDVLQKKASLHEEMDQISKSVETWQRVLDLEPCSETAYQNLMILYADSGQKTRAIKLFEECRMVLESELGVLPDTETCQIYDKIRSG